MQIQPAKIHFNEQGTPVAEDFDDVYFSNQNGLQETRYVFLENNQLPQKWLTSSSDVFCIAETGFGTGLNFLATWQLFENAAPEKMRLHFISTEKFPIPVANLDQALRAWPELRQYAEQLVGSYPDILAGCHRLVFDDGRVVLDLHFGDVQDIFQNLHNSDTGIVDAWYLDGFAPSKNPQMWSEALFLQIARLSKAEASFATFTAAGAVKRGLAEQGFTVRKVPGFGRKREMLAGHFPTPTVDRGCQSYFYRSGLQINAKSAHVGIVGGGIAAANLAVSLVQRGCRVSVFCKDKQLAQGASGNPQGGFYPQLNAQANIASRIQATSFGFAARRYQQLLDAGFAFQHQWCGVLQLAFNDNVQARQNSLFGNAIWPDSLIKQVDQTTCQDLAGVPIPVGGAHVPKGGWIAPAELVHAMFDYATATGECNLHLNSDVQHIDKAESQWQVFCQSQVFSVDALIIATGADIQGLTKHSALPANLVRGQVEAVPSQLPLNQLKSVICHKGYLTPALQNRHALGSTYVKQDTSRAYRKQEGEDNLRTHQKALQGVPWVASLGHDYVGRAAIRCSLPDHLPLVGSLFDENQQKHQFGDLYKALPMHRYPRAENTDGLYVLAGLGSRGLTTAPLMAELLVSQMMNEPLPMDNQLLAALNPNRFLIKALVRRQVSCDEKS